MAETKERTLPSLVADDLVDLSRRVLARPQHALTKPDTDEPWETADGIAVAYPYAILELLVEIRDLLRGDDSVPRILHVATATPEGPAEPTTLDVDDLGRLRNHLRRELAKLYLDSVRLDSAVEYALGVFERYMNEKGLLR